MSDKTQKSILDDFHAMRKEIQRHNQLYYGDDSPEISDAEYDALLHKLEEMVAQNPWLADEPTVAHAPQTHFSKAPHQTPLLSLEKAHSEKDMLLFLNRVSKILKQKKANISIIAQPKIDGLAIALTYKDGMLTSGKTRGDGHFGEEITKNVLCIKNIPTTIPGSPDCEIRGEVYIKTQDFLQLNKQQEKKGLPTFINPRNAASGSLRQLDTNVTQARPLLFIAYSVYGINFERESESLEWLENTAKFDVPQSSTTQSPEDIQDIYQKIYTQRSTFPMDIDGVVYKVDHRPHHHILGATAHHPRWAIAYKFPSESGISQLKNIIVQIGKSGAITPVAILAPITVGGVTITRASLHNFSFIQEKRLAIGDHVVVERAGDVIPYVHSVARKSYQGVEYTPPTQCPSCHHALSYTSDRVLQCGNDECPEQIIKKLSHFSSKQGLNIQSLGEQQTKQLYDYGMIRKYADILTLPDNPSLHLDLAQKPQWGERSITALTQSIRSASHTTMPRLLTALSIPSVGSSTATHLSQHYPTLQAFTQIAHPEELQKKGFGLATSQKIHAFLTEKTIRDLQSLHHLVHYKNTQKPKPSRGVFTITGTLVAMTRSEAAAHIEKNGYTFSSRLSKTSNFLIVGSNPGNKIQQAKKLGIQIISEKDFFKMIPIPASQIL